MDFRIKALSLRGSEATEAIHNEKADSSMDRHADKSARDDRKSRSATNLHKHAGGRILRLESGLCKVSAEIRLGCLSHKRAEAIHDSSPKANAKNQRR